MKVVAELEPEVAEQYKRKAVRKIAESAKIPGFRPGKAPADVIRRMYGEKAIEEQAVELMVDDIYPKMLDEAGIKPGAPGSLEEIISVDPPKFSFLVPLEPSVDLGDYRSIRKEFNAPAVEEKEIDAFLQRLRRSYASAEPVERAAEDGDMIYFKLKGELADPKEGEDSILIHETPDQRVIGETSGDEPDDFPFEGFSALLKGLKAGDEKVIEHTYPKDSKYEHLRERKAIYTVVVDTVKMMTPPAMDDEFAQNVGQFENLEQLRGVIRDQLEHTAMHDYEDKYFSELITDLIGKATLKYPPQMLNEEIEHVLDSIKQDLSRQKLDLNTYLKLNQKEEATFITEEVTPIARRRLEQSLVMDAVVDKEKIELKPEELNEAFSRAIQELAQTNDLKKLQKEMGGADKLANAVAMQTATRLINARTLDRLKEIAAGMAEATVTAAGEEPAEPAKPAKKKTAKSKKAEEKADGE